MPIVYLEKTAEIIGSTNLSSEKLKGEIENTRQLINRSLLVMTFPGNVFVLLCGIVLATLPPIAALPSAYQEKVKFIPNVRVIA